MDQITLDLLSDSISIPKECETTIKQLHASPIFDDEELCANQLRKILSSCSLNYESLESNSSLLLSMSKHVGVNTYGALWTRFTVQYNLFAGSIITLGSKKQREALYKLQKEDNFGCFSFYRMWRSRSTYLVDEELRLKQT